MAIAVASALPIEDADYNDVQGDMELALQVWNSIGFMILKLVDLRFDSLKEGFLDSKLK